VTGRLFLVTTPIGNLSDLTPRALSTLREVSVIAAEDTRRSRALLTHFEITGKTLVSCNAYAGEGTLGGLIARLHEGQDVALVTDAGTPSVSDPGTALVRACVAESIPVLPIPGVSAVTTAIAASGLVDGPFLFLGFLPTKGKKREQLLQRIARSTEPVVLFESPYRCQRTLEGLAELIPERSAVLCRELTKLHEEFRRGSLRELSLHEQAYKGEITLVIAAEPTNELEPEEEPADLDEQIMAELRAGVSPKSVVEALSERASSSKREFYRRVTELADALREDADED